MQICTVTVTCVFNILIFFSLSSLCLTHLPLFFSFHQRHSQAHNSLFLSSHQSFFLWLPSIATVVDLSSLFSFNASLNLSSFGTLWLWLSFRSSQWCLDRSFGSDHGHLWRLAKNSNYSDDEVFGGVFIRIRFYNDDGSSVTLRTRALEVFLLAATSSMIGV